MNDVVSTAFLFTACFPRVRVISEPWWPRYSVAYFRLTDTLVLHPIPWLDVVYPERDRLIQRQVD